MDTSTLRPNFESAFELLGKRWTGLIIRVMLSGKQRFSEIHVVIPSISDRMLTKRLKELQTMGIVQRRVYPEVPVRIEYELTEMGKSLAPVMDSVQQWATSWA
ncbi:winged helix-turn-helix transcriptional regulator [Alicyclobacillus mengziensis]|uniref:Helix-turn-helix transcriptional regulator n=1 Tax=Alicyclobacillus mengziensis TaxID=2931921 RepID=A0A9X7W3P4_9BACL|nr:helix-turn-helix domain-containing protein [Alicyclobacillus mengziensis]QSO50061.1 helix-turn-helix transcriptional regulator [Alicyclobacillus mengziensis]